MPFPLIAALITAAVFVAGQLLQPAPPFENAKKKSLADFDRPTASTSRAIPVIFGRVKYQAPNLLWWGDYLTAPKIKHVRYSLLKPPKEVITAWRYYLGMCLGFSWGKVDSLTKIWIDDKVAWTGEAHGGDRFLIDQATLFGGEDKDGNAGEGGVYAWCQFYDGNGTQAPNAYLQAQATRAPVGKVPARKRRAYLVFEGPSGERAVNYTGNSSVFGGSSPVVTLSGYVGITGAVRQMAFELSRWPDALGEEHKRIGDDANPIHCVYEMLTADYYGGGLSSALVDATSFLAASETVYNEGMGVSFIWDGTSLIEDKVIDVLKVVDGTVFPDWQDGKLHVKLARDDYDVDDLMELGDGNGVSELSNFTRVVEQATNQVVTMYTDRTRDYATTSSTPATDIASARRVGIKPSNPLDYSMVTSPVIAQQLAERELRLLATPLGKGSIVCDRRASRLRPGDVFKFSWSPLGFTQMIVRVTRVRYGSLGQGKVEIDFVQDVFKLAGSIYSQSGGTLWTSPLQPPQPVTNARVEEWPYLLAKQGAQVQTDPEKPMLLAVAGKSVPGDLAYTHWVSEDGGTTYTERAADVDFAPIGTLVANLDPFTGGDIIDGVQLTVDQVANLTIASLADIAGSVNHIITPRGEWLAYETFTIAGNTITFNNVWRAVFDTTPKKHFAGDKWYFAWYGESLPEDTFTDGQATKSKITPRNGRGVLSLADATAINYTIVSRALMPMPPAGLLINGDYDQVIYTGTPDWVLAWEERNRLTQTEVVSQLSGTVAPEAGVTYEVRIYDWDGITETLIKTVTALGTAGYTYLHSDEIVDNGRGVRSPALIFKVRSVRAGINNYQDYVRTVTTEPGYGSSGYGVSYGE